MTSLKSNLSVNFLGIPAVKFSRLVSTVLLHLAVVFQENLFNLEENDKCSQKRGSCLYIHYCFRI